MTQRAFSPVLYIMPSTEGFVQAVALQLLEFANPTGDLNLQFEHVCLIWTDCC
jgi:hypothetical protein